VSAHAEQPWRERLAVLAVTIVERAAEPSGCSWDEPCAS
jgi:hypothetical protein